MSRNTLQTLEAGRLSQRDRDRVAAAVDALCEREDLPGDVVDFVANILRLAAAGRDVTAVPGDTALTTNQAALMLGMSRPFLIKLLDDGRLPHHYVGRDRRIKVSDVRAYVERRDSESRRLAEAAAARDDRRRRHIAAAADLTLEEATRLGL